MARVAPYGSWESPVTAEAVAAAGTVVSSVSASGSDVYWLESRPEEQGRVVLVRRDGAGQTRDVTPEGFSVRTSVHEYGGGAYFVDGSTVFFSNWSDQRLWRQEPSAPPRPLTSPGLPAPPGPFGSARPPEAPLSAGPAESVSFADGRSLPGGRFVVCVRETHRGSSADKVTNEIVVIDATGAGAVASVVSGHDFFAAPRPSPDGRQLAWISWDHPNMPWDGTDLWVARVSPDGEVAEPVHVAGGRDESVVQPRWAGDGTLWYVSDRTGWWNLYRLGDESPVVQKPAEFAGPAWTFGGSNHVELEDGSVACAWSSGGTDHLGLLDPSSADLREIEVPYTSIESLAASGSRVVFIAASPSTGREVVSLDPGSGGARVLRPAPPTGIGEDHISLPEPIEFPTSGGSAYGLYYPPTNPDFTGREGELPPLLVVGHGGPTGAARQGLNLALQFWTSRGIGVVDVNYRGSTGYGRAFRRLLEGRWGVADVQDCIAAAEFLARTRRVDGSRLLIRGASAGGLTTLLVLIHSDRFAAGGVYYGVADLEALAKETHKFESRYLDRLVGPYPERRDVYLERSPITHVDDLDRPVIWFQGDEDRVVPPAQAEAMVEAMRERGIPCAYVVFEGEQHGFRKASSLVTSLREELSFYGGVLGFEPADRPVAGDPAPPVPGP